MARRFGRLNEYDSRLRRCARSGLRFYESEMAHVNGKWIHPKYLDSDETARRPMRKRSRA
jgi:hypothetical protein